MFGFYRMAAGVPTLNVADVAANTTASIALSKQACDEHVALLVLPELGLCGYSCADLFHQSALLDAVRAAIGDLCAATQSHPHVLVVGAPLRHQGRLYNCAVVLQTGAVIGVVPKSFLPTYKEFYEKRWFCSGADVSDAHITLNGGEVPFGTDLLFDCAGAFTFGVEICEDLWAVIPPSSRQALAGATVLVNPSASNELVAKADYRRELVCHQSARCVAAYVYTSCGVHESTTDVVFSGHSMIADNGALLAEGERFSRDATLITADVDCERLAMTRVRETSMDDPVPSQFRRLSLSAPPASKTLRNVPTPKPFVPADQTVRDERCHEIFSIQATGLAKRLDHIHAKSAIIGISGGLDSTLALLVAHEAFNLLQMPMSQLVSVTMPGFGTTDRTYQNAVALAKELGTDLREINITAACMQHFQDIGHDPDVHDVTYENVQARERTQILMDLANKEGGIVIGTGDLSEVALGWSTYNGDQMSMYGVNSSVPKTLIRYVIDWVADVRSERIRAILKDILDTPISPELLPSSEDGEIVQKTEEVVGPYELHDFFLYHTVKYGAPPAKSAWLAEQAFAGRFDRAEIERWLTVFCRRFFAQQFKRSCFPDGPKVGTISLSPRGDWRMPSDAVPITWLATLDGDKGDAE